MSYTEYYAGGWRDSPSTATPITAAALENMETGIASASSTATSSATAAAAAQATASAAIAKSTATTAGDILYATGASAITRLAIGSVNRVLGSVGGLPSWVASLQSLMTTTGDLLYASSANTPARRAIGSTGDVLTVAGGVPTWAAPAATTSGPGTELDYAQITTPGTTTATTEGTATVIITGASTAYDGTRNKIEVYSPKVSNSGASSVVTTLVLLRDSTVLCAVPTVNSPLGSYVVVFDTPSVANHTYKVSAFTGSGTGTVGAGAGGSGNQPAAFIRVTKA